MEHDHDTSAVVVLLLLAAIGLGGVIWLTADIVHDQRQIILELKEAAIRERLRLEYEQVMEERP